jgi:hypothetical protein
MYDSKSNLGFYAPFAAANVRKMHDSQWELLILCAICSYKRKKNVQGEVGVMDFMRHWQS